MKLILDKMDILIANKKMECDAFTVWMQAHHNFDSSQKEKAVYAAFASRNGILEKQQYIYYEFIDCETGEILEMNCTPIMDSAMIKANGYPPIIIDAIKEFNQKVKNVFV